MVLHDLLKDKSLFLIEEWFKELLSQFPPNSVQFLKKKEKQFSNPMGYNLYQGLETIWKYLMGDEEKESVFSVLEDFLKIVAVQEWNPSQSLSFFFDLKKILIREFGIMIEKESLLSDWINLEAEIDFLALTAFDFFMQSREKLYDIRAKQIKQRTFRLLKQANLISESPSAYTLNEGGLCC